MSATYSAPLGRLHELSHAHPERTARRDGSGAFSDVFFRVFTNRTAMARCIRMQERAGTRNAWRALVTLSPGEGY